MPRRALVLLLPLLALLVAACGGGGSLSLDPVAAAATKTQDAQTFKVDFDATVQARGRTFSFSGTGGVDLASNETEMSMDLSGLPLPQGSGGTADFVFANGKMYVKMPLLAKELPSGKQWLEIDVAKAAAARGLDLGSFQNADPAQGLERLQAAGDVQKVGTDTIQGEEMTHYHAVIDVARAANLTARQRAALRTMLRGTSGTIPVDVWVDGAGRVRRETMSFSYGKALRGAQMAMTMNFSDFGSPVTVTVPPADQVQDVTSLIAKQPTA